MARHPIQVVSLIGMPGSGKSTVGVLLAKRPGLAFVDTDLLIQEQEQATLAEIIAAKGHEALRVIEEQVLLEMDIGSSVISTGGSVVYSEAIMNRLSNASTVVYLRSQLATVEYRKSFPRDLITSPRLPPSNIHNTCARLNRYSRIQDAGGGQAMGNR